MVALPVILGLTTGTYIYLRAHAAFAKSNGTTGFDQNSNKYSNIIWNQNGFCSYFLIVLFCAEVSAMVV
jgi:hypothetical protein